MTPPGGECSRYSSHHPRAQLAPLALRGVSENPRGSSCARAAARAAGLPHRLIDAHAELQPGIASLATMHMAKGLEFRSVAVMACDEEVLPLQARIETAAEDTDVEEVYNTERQLLYVACTRARDNLLVTAVKPGSEFLDDMGG